MDDEWSDGSKIEQTKSRTCANMCTQGGEIGRPHELLIHFRRNGNYRQEIAVEAGQAKNDQMDLLRGMTIIESKHKVAGGLFHERANFQVHLTICEQLAVCRYIAIFLPFGPRAIGCSSDETVAASP